MLLILVRLEQHQDWCWASSAVVQYEIEKTPDSERRRRVRALAAIADVRAELTDEVVARAMEVRSWGFEAVDALHVACAEALRSDVLLTTDDGVLKAARRNAGRINVRVANPVDWLRERNEA